MSSNPDEADRPLGPVVEKRRLETIRRTASVRAVKRLTPRTVQITLAGEQLAGFDSPSPDDHIKAFFSLPSGEIAARDYTPRRYDPAALTLDLEFFLHEGGAGSDWAAHAQPGDTLDFGGPRGTTLVSAPGCWWLLIGDETASPSIARRLEELPGGTPVTVVLAVNGPQEERTFSSAADLTTHWVHRPDTLAADVQPFMNVLAGTTLPPGPGFIWIAAEDSIVRQLRAYFIETRQHPPEWIKASAYWTHRESR